MRVYRDFRRFCRRRGFGTLHLYVGLMFLILFFPVAVLILFSFANSGDMRFPLTGLSLRWYREVFSDSSVLSGIVASLEVAFFTGLIVTCIGTPAVTFLSRHRFRGSGLVTAMILAPAALPGIVIGVALLNGFGDIRYTLSLVTVTVGQIVYCLPYFYLILNARLKHFDPSLEEAAMDLGAGPFQRFRRVIAPLVAPAILGATLVVLALSWDEFQITFFTIGDQSTLPLVIWSRARRVIDPSVNAIGTLMIAGSLLIVLLTRRFIVDSYS
jgi:spermidine/putrescine transport system permease protein